MSEANITELDVRGVKCPMPIVKAKKALDTLPAGHTLKVVATDKGSVLDFQGWAKTNKAADLTRQETLQEGGTEVYVHYLTKKA
ncbi:MAG: sulfurtransferase TusA family protein [Candidatus Sericytochromatia bacterium]|nr:sulfurtransferase TusA family protein [Candidatus Sericytochromatia bacterium]